MKFLISRPLSKTATTLLVTLASISPLLAQDAGGGASSSLLDKYFIAGGVLTWIIVVFGMLSAIGLVVFNFMNLTKGKYCPADLKAGLYDHMVNCRVRSAIELSASSPSYLGRMLAYSLPKVDATQPETLGKEQVEDAMADFSLNESRRQMVWINLISLLAAAAPMMGLFGTVVGMVETFALLAEGSSTDASTLAGKISIALLTTMWGLVIALISLAAYFFFKNRFNGLVAECHDTAEELMNASIQTVNGDAQLAKIPEGLAM